MSRNMWDESKSNREFKKVCDNSRVLEMFAQNFLKNIDFKCLKTIFLVSCLKQVELNLPEQSACIPDFQKKFQAGPFVS